MEDWAGVYKLVRLAVLAVGLCGIAVYLYTGNRGERLEEPARRMLEDEE